MFERAPFSRCIKCSDATGLGFLSAGGSTVQFRCRSCGFRHDEPLPDVDKKVVYLDQFAFSELFKLEAGKLPASHPHYGFWSELHATMRECLLLQQVIFPSSDVHSGETLVSREHQSLREAYERLGGDTSFLDTRQVEEGQVYECFTAYRSNRLPIFDTSVDRVLKGSRNVWLPEIRIVVKTDYSVFSTSFREDVDQTARSMVGLVQRWREQKPDFSSVLHAELTTYPSIRISALQRVKDQFDRAQQSDDPTDMLFLAGNQYVSEFANLCRVYEKDGLSPDEVDREVVRFWHWAENLTQPYHRTSAYLFAALSRKIVAGQKKDPTRGFVNDVRAIAAYGPYVDAMFLDKECAALLNESPLREELNLKARIFSLNNHAAFLEYLRELSTAAADETRRYAAMIYGFR